MRITWALLEQMGFQREAENYMYMDLGLSGEEWRVEVHDAFEREGEGVDFVLRFGEKRRRVLATGHPIVTFQDLINKLVHLSYCTGKWDITSGFKKLMDLR